MAQIPNFRGEYSYDITYPFPAGPVVSIAAAGGTGNTEVRTQDSNYYFIGTHVMGAVWLATASIGTSLIGTPLIDIADPSPPAVVGNVMPSTNLVTVSFFRGSLGDSDVFRPWSIAVGTAKFPLILESAVLLAPLTQSQWKLVNNTAASPIVGSITIKGRQVPRDAYYAWSQANLK